MFRRSVVIRNPTGLHVRPAGLFVETARRFRSSVEVLKGEQRVDGRSMVALMLLEVVPGTELVIEAQGEDEEEAANALANLVESGFAEKMPASGAPNQAAAR